jgi:hypothetical protein
MNKLLTRYWFEFEYDGKWGLSTYRCGVTAFTYDDAINIMRKSVFQDNEMPVIKKCIENVDIRDLDQNHVVLNMRPPSIRGVWYPMRYDTL